jgi:hypothetical protein
MYKSEIKDLQDELKRWQRFRDACEHHIGIICHHELLSGCQCNLALCPGGFDESKGTKFTADALGPFIG